MSKQKQTRSAYDMHMFSNATAVVVQDLIGRTNYCDTTIELKREQHWQRLGDVATHGRGDFCRQTGDLCTDLLTYWLGEKLSIACLSNQWDSYELVNIHVTSLKGWIQDKCGTSNGERDIFFMETKLFGRLIFTFPSIMLLRGPTTK